MTCAVAHVHASAQPPLVRPVSLPRPSSGVASLLRVQALTNNEAELLIYGPIGEDWWSESVTAKQVVEQLGVTTATMIRVRINSEGGSVQDGLAIHNALQRHPARIVVTVDGLAASIASLIAMAGDEIVMPVNTLMMIHAPWAYAGVRIMKPQLYDGLPVERFSALKIWDGLIPKGRLAGHPLDRFWLHVGDPKALADAEIWIACHGG